MNWALKASKLPKSRSMALASAPAGAALASAAAIMFGQKMACNRWPEPWNAASRDQCLTSAKSPAARASASLASALFSPVTYPAWWMS
jgi:hypothetical protein